MSNNDDLRNRFKAAHNRRTGQDKDAQDIGAIWEEQKKSELKRAQQQARKKTGKSKKHKSNLSNIYARFTTVLRVLISLPSKLINTILESFYLSRVKKPVFIILVLAFIGVSSFFVLRQFSSNHDSTATLGESSSAERVVEELPEATPLYDLLFPAGIDPSLYQVRLSSPPAQPDPAYTYLDRPIEGGVVVQVTQQAEPDNFNLAEAAEGFGLSSVIQIDGNNIYHGFSERGGIQSLIFTKENRIVSIRSPQKLSDDAWVNYILSLQLQQ